MRRLLVILFAVLILIVTHHAIYTRERLVSEGEVVLLRLAPVDPRSLIQGDYMRLRFAVADELRETLGDREVGDGQVILGVGEDRVGRFVRFDDGSPLRAGEHRMRYRLRDRRIRLGTNAFFFEEGTAAVYSQARYGEFRIGADGSAILTHLRGENRQRLPPGSAS